VCEKSVSVLKKITKNVSQTLIFSSLIPNFFFKKTVNFFKLKKHKGNNRPNGRNSPNQVTLVEKSLKKQVLRGEEEKSAGAIGDELQLPQPLSMSISFSKTCVSRALEIGPSQQKLHPFRAGQNISAGCETGQLIR
jgi:hypothetical protein